MHRIRHSSFKILWIRVESARNLVRVRYLVVSLETYSNQRVDIDSCIHTQFSERQMIVSSYPKVPGEFYLMITVVASSIHQSTT